MIHKTIKQTEVEERVCDFCGEDRKVEKKCPVCRKDICFSCAILTDDHLSAGHYTDYPDYYCRGCWKIGEPFIQEILSIRAKAEELDDLEESVMKKWHNAIR